jgi:2-hydroxy-3-oxopropionate reductase
MRGVIQPKFERSTTKVGFIGVGAMGGGMAACLLAKGWDVEFYSRQPQRGTALAAAGATRATSVSTLGHKCRLIFLCLPDASTVEHVVLAQLIDFLEPGSCVVDTSSTSASTAREVGRRLHERGCRFLDAPVSGGQPAAQEGRLTCMVGGEQSVLDACREPLDAFCQSITHVGPVGSGQIVKGCNQVAVAGALLGVADAVALAAAQGLDPFVMREVLLKGTASSMVLNRHAPKIIERQFAPGFRAELMRKDLRTALQSAKEVNVNLPVTRLAAYLLDCLCASGFSEWDWSAVALTAQWQSGNGCSTDCERETTVDAATAGVGG